MGRAAGLAVALLLGWAACRSAARQAPAGARPAALVNGEAIGLAELDAELKRNGPVAVPLPSGMQREAQRQTLGQLIDNLLIDQFLRTNASPVAPNAVDAKLAEIAQDLQKEKKTLADFLRDTNQTEAELRKSVERGLRFYDFAQGQATDAALQRYYADLKDFFDGTTVRLSHILIPLPPNAADAEVARAQAQLTALRGEIAAGKFDFAAAAKAHSQCPSARDGGDLGFVARKWQVDEPLARAAFALRPGEVSDVVRTAAGLHLVKVAERKPGPGSDFARAKEEVRDLFLVELREAVLIQLRRSAKIEVYLP
jgi:peptidyl-prolyl cis-trans isomerase C